MSKVYNRLFLKRVSILLWGFGVLFNLEVYGQCSSNIPIAQKFCTGDQPIFDITGATTSDKYGWYTYAGSIYSFQQYQNIQFVGSSGSTSPPTYYYYEKEITGTLGQIAINAHGSSAQTLAATDSLRQSFTNQTAIRINTVQIAVKMYNTNNVRVQVNVGSQYSAWFVFNRTQATLASGSTDVYLVDVPVNLTIPTGTHSLAIRSTSSGGVNAVDGFVNYSNSSLFTYPYTLGSSGESVTINSSVNNSGIFNWNVTRLCGKQNIIPNPETPANCCQPITDIVTISAQDTIVVLPINDLITVSGVTGTAFYKWYRNGVAISGAEGNDLKTYTATQTGTYSVRIVRDQTKLANPNCYELKLIDIQPRQLFVTPKTSTICYGESLDLTSSGALGNFNWTYLNNSNASNILDANNIQNPIVTPLTVGALTLKLTADVDAGDLITNGDFEAGNNGSFSTNYTYTASPTFSSCLGNPGYSIQTVSNGCCIWLPCTDANGGGKFFYGDPNNQTPNDNVWSQTVNTVANQDYIFSAFFTNISSVEGIPGSAICSSPPGRVIIPANYTTKDIDPIFQIYINNQAVGTTHTTTGSACDWTEHRFTWNSGSGGPTTIAIRVANATQGGGNAGKDFGLDKISFFTAVKKQADTLHITVNDCDVFNATATCNSGVLTLKATTTNGIFDSWAHIPTSGSASTVTITDPKSATTTATPIATTKEYEATFKFIRGNLVANPDYSTSGKNGTTMTDRSSQAGSYGFSAGEYEIGIAPATYSNTADKIYVNVPDHTTGSATNFNYFSGSGIYSAGKNIVFSQTISTTNGSEYAFSAWLANIHKEFTKASPDTIGGTYPNGAKSARFELYIGGTLVKKITLTPNTSWNELSYIYKATSTANVTFELRVPTFTNTNSLDAAFAMDDVSIGAVDTRKKTVTTPCTTPVTFTYFTLNNTETGIGIYWGTASEQDIALFVVQRSRDGYHFEDLAWLKSKGSGTDYSSLDSKPQEGTLYYRIKEQSKKGDISYTNVLVISRLGDEEVSVYPNPSHENFTVYLKGQEGESVQARILSTEGTELQKLVLLTNVNNSLGGQLSAGLYLLEIRKASGLVYLKIIKE